MNIVIFAALDVGPAFCDMRFGDSCEAAPSNWPRIIAYCIGLILLVIAGIVIYRWKKKHRRF